MNPTNRGAAMPELNVKLVEGKLKCTALLQNPDGLYSETHAVQYPEGKGRAAMYQFIAAVNGTQGFLQEVGPLEVRFIPMARVKDFTVTLEENTIQLASNLGNLSAALRER